MHPGLSPRAAWRHRIIVGAALASGLVLTALAVRGVIVAREDQSRSEFERRADTIQSHVVRELDLVVSSLKGARAAHGVAGHMDDADLEAVMDGLDIDSAASGVYGLGVVERVRRDDGADRFELRHVQPSSRNAAVLGTDLASDDAAREAMHTATDTGRATLSARVRLAQDAGTRVGWIMLLPIYQGPTTSLEQRRESLVGFTYAAAVADDVLAPVSELLGNEVRYRVYDGEPAQDRLLYDSNLAAPIRPQAMRTSRSSLVANRVLTIEFEATPALHAPAGAYIVAAVGGGGALLSLLLALSAWLLLSGRRRALGLAERMTADLRGMARELETARDTALTASQAKTRFLSAMSHEIRTPMNAIMGMLRLLHDSGLSGKQKDYAVKAEGAARSLLSLINDILDLSKIEAGKMELDCRPFSLESLLAEVSVVLAASVGEKELEVLYELDPRLPPWLVGDELRLRQIVLNLAANAVKFTSTGEVVVEWKLLQELQELPGAVRIELAVRDTGLGISKEQQQILFEDYTQASGSIARQFGGTGLGLGICRRLAALMGSELRLESEPGKGSRFSMELSLPVAPRSQPSSELAIERVLIVDDNACARESLAAMARSQGWEADVAASGEQALECVAQASRTYDAIFVDWRMPGMDGWATSMRIRELPAGAQPPLLVMVTAMGRETLSRRPAPEQALLDGFLVKPVTAAMLREALAQALSGSAGAIPDEAPPPVRALAGLRLLLAEDNALNREIASALLTGQGAEVDVVDDGAKAVERLRAGEAYDLVLMDVQMPVLDGLEATRIIRGELGITHLPIVAMTANAMASDREECLAAGMNEHVGKPFVLDELVATILRLARKEEKEEEDHLLLDRESAIQRMGGEARLFERLIPVFRENGEAAMRAVQALAQGEAPDDEARRVVHTLKGMAATMGAVRLSRAAAKAETLLSEGVPADAQCQKLLAALRDTLHALPEEGK